jgi:D-alanine-D-alanine ligase
MRITVLHQAVPQGAPADELDVLQEAAAVSATLETLGHQTRTLPVDLDLSRTVAALRADAPDLVFNLCESLPGAGRGGKLAAVPAALVESLGLPMTGNSAAALSVTADKLATKRLFREAGIPTPAWLPDDGTLPAGRLIVKRSDEHGSIGLGPDSVVADCRAAQALLSARAAEHGGEWFVEQFVEGREFSLALLGDVNGGVELLPIAEFVYLDAWPDGRPRILDYPGKWDQDDPVFPLSERQFHTTEPGLAARLEQLARAAWRAFGLAGYARIDFRVAHDGTPFALEVNANPCLTPEVGLAAGAEALGMNFEELIGRIVAAAVPPPRRAAACREGVPAALSSPPPPLRERVGNPPRVGNPARVGVEGRFRTCTLVTDPGAVEQLARATEFFAPHEITVARELAQAAADGDPHYRMLYADGPSGLAGWACFGPTPCTDGAWDLYWIVVHPAAQRTGLGRALVEAACRAARAEGARALYAETAGKPQYAPTRRFYSAAGFCCQAELPDFYAVGDAKLIYRRALA